VGVAIRIRRWLFLVASQAWATMECGRFVHEHELNGALGLEFAMGAGDEVVEGPTGLAFEGQRVRGNEAMERRLRAAPQRLSGVMRPLDSARVEREAVICLSARMAAIPVSGMGEGSLGWASRKWIGMNVK
jgi:hypothetical protein